VSWCTGHCFHFKDTDKKSHLYVIIAQDADPPTRCLVVNVTHIREGKPYDDSCVFAGGEHRCIPDPSWAWYKKAIICGVDKLEDNRRSGQQLWQEEKEFFDSDILMRLQTGGLHSPEMSPDNREFLGRYLGL
jgi:hypothetical protein